MGQTCEKREEERGRERRETPSRERSERLDSALSRGVLSVNEPNCSLTVNCAPSHLWMIRLFLLRILEVMYG